jgi:hypothetical protein
MKLAKARYELPQEGDASRLIAALCEVSMDRWYAAALAVASDPLKEPAEQGLDLALRFADPILLWNAHDDLDTALYRVTSPASNSPMSVAKKSVILATTRRAVAALVCSRLLDEVHLLTLTSPFIELIGEFEVGA